MKTIKIAENLFADVNPSGVVVYEIQVQNGRHHECRRHFKNVRNAARKLRDELAEALAFEADCAESVRAGEANWKGEANPLASALARLEAA